MKEAEKLFVNFIFFVFYVNIQIILVDKRKIVCYNYFVYLFHLMCGDVTVCQKKQRKR